MASACNKIPVAAHFRMTFLHSVTAPPDWLPSSRPHAVIELSRASHAGSGNPINSALEIVEGPQKNTHAASDRKMGFLAGGWFGQQNSDKETRDVEEVGIIVGTTSRIHNAQLQGACSKIPQYRTG